MDILIEIILEIIAAAIEYSFDSKQKGRRMDMTSSNKSRLISKKKITNIYELKKQEHKFFLLVAILLYIYYEEDLNFSVQEKQKVKRYIRLSSIVTHRRTRKDLKRMIKYKVTMQNLTNIISDYSLTKEEVNETFELIKKHMSRRDKELKYYSLLGSIHSKLLREF